MPILAKTNKVLPSWAPEAAELMARTGVGLIDAVTELGVEITSEQAYKTTRLKGFQSLLWGARHRFFLELGADPQFTQDVVVGKLLANAQKLEEQGEFDKASEVLLKIAKVKNWVGGDTQVNILGDLTDKDIKRLKEKIALRVSEGNRGNTDIN